MTAPYSPRTTCRCCGSADLTQVLDLGPQRVSDFPRPEDLGKVPVVPVTLDLCRGCTLVQARYTPPAEDLYRRHYWYRSGVTQTMRDHLQELAVEIDRRVEVRAGDVVLDVGANDGTLLGSYWFGRGHARHWATRVAVEPARNLADECRKHCDVMVNDFWSEAAYRKVWTNLYSGGSPILDTDRWRPKVVTAIGMLYDLDDPNQFVADVARVLRPDGLFVAQLQCLKQTLALGDVGNFCHEHLEFYTLASLHRLLASHGLVVADVEENSVNGGSYRVYARHAKAGDLTDANRAGLDRVERALREESEAALGMSWIWSPFAVGLARNRDACVSFLRSARAEGKKVWVYGASTKGNVILQYYGVGPDLVEAAADRSPEKHGRVTCTGVPIRSEEEFRRAAPDYALVLPYSFLGEFLDRERTWRDGGGRFLVPLPEFKVI